MTIITIELIDPRAKALLEDLENMDLIRIIAEEKPDERLSALLRKLRSKAEEAPGMEAISKEVELVRSRRKGGTGME